MKTLSAWICARFCFLLLLIFYSSAGFSQHDDIKKAPAPDWVVNIKVKKPVNIPSDKIKGGIYYLLSDRQLKVTDSEKQKIYHHFADYIVNSHGLESSSQLDVSFDPSYQTLTFHSLRLLREGKVIDKLHNSKYSVLQREQELEKLIYDGRLSANVILDDVRVGDIVDYSYSIEGTNPVYRNNFSYSFYTQWSVPLKHQFVRVLWEKTKPLKITQLNQKLEPDSRPYAGGIEYIFETHDPVPLTMNSQVPDWYDPYARVILTDSQSWQDIVDWALPLYTAAMVPNSEVATIAQQIRTQHTTLDAQIHAALAFVQSEIRYLGLEMGENSHQPSPAEETLNRRYGDCKDKTVLLITLLKALDVTAHPALVNSSFYKEIAKQPPSTAAFDHVIVYLKHQDRDIWLDPTRQHQPGNLHTLHQPDFGYALVIASATNDLTSMAAERLSKQVVNDVFDLHEGIGSKSKYTVTTEYYGYEAERQRNSIANSSNSDTTEQYLNYYKNYFPEINLVAPLNTTELNNGAGLSVAEYYEIQNIWESDDSGRYTATFYANTISANLVKVEEAKRNSPFYLRYPNHVVQEIKIHLPARTWNLPDEKFEEINPFFEYRRQVKFNEKTNTLTLTYEYQALADQVPAEKIPDYIKARKIADDDAQYKIFNYLEMQETEPHLLLYLISGFVLYLALLGFIVANWYRDEQRKIYYSQAIFYPVSLLKLAVLGILTLGVFNYYWFYRNWSYVKRVYESHSLPFWRSFFSYLWFYPLAYRIVNSDAPKLSAVVPRSSVALALLAVIYFAASMLESMDFYGLLALLTVIALTLWLAHQVNQFIQPDRAIYAHHSRWYLRHLLLILLFTPMTFLYVGSEVRVLPSSRVVAGNHMLQHDINFMRRNKLIPVHEELIYFYSDAQFNIRRDGNGFTKSQVFSYWKDDNDKLNIEIAKLHEIEKIVFNDDVDWSENATITIHREDGSDFLLYLSTEKKGHRKFEQQLRLLWQEIRLNSEIKRAFAKTSLSEDAEVKKLQHNITQVMPAALFRYESKTQNLLAQLYSRGIVVNKDLKRAIYFYNLAYQQGEPQAGVDLVWHLAVSGKELERALSIAEDLLELEDTSSTREILAATYASMGDFNRAIAEQQRAVESATEEQKAGAMRKLKMYQASRPWTQLWPDVTSDASALFLLINVAPRYPRSAVEKGVEGNIVFEFDVLKNGRLANIEVLSAEPEGYFEEAGREALDRFLYLPAMVEGEAVVTKGVNNQFVFELAD